MNFGISGDGFSFQSSLDQARYRLQEEEESHRRQQRNQEIRAKLQELKLRSLLESSRSEMLRQMQNEHKALVQKYLVDQQKLPIFNPTTHAHHQGMIAHNLTRKDPTTTFVSTGINTELTGPVAAVHPSEIPFSAEILLPVPNFNQPSPAVTGMVSGAGEEGDQMIHSVPVLPFSSFEYNKVTGDETGTTTTSKITFLQEPSTSESEMTTSTRGGGGGESQQRRFSASHLTPTAAALQKFLTDETSESNPPTTSISAAFSRRKSYPGILNVTSQLAPPFQPMVRTISKEMPGDGVGTGKSDGGNDEDEGGWNSESETTTIGESILDPPPPPSKATGAYPNPESSQRDGNLTSNGEKEQSQSHKRENKTNLGGKDESGNYGGDSAGNNCHSGENKSTHSSSPSSDDSVKMEEGNSNSKTKETSPLEGTKGKVAGMKKEEDEDAFPVNAIKNPGTGESGSHHEQVVKVSEEEAKGGEHQHQQQKSHQFKLKLGMYEDSESEKSEIEFRDSAKNAAVGSVEKKKFENTTRGEEGKGEGKAKKAEEEEDDDLDDFFDL